LGRYEFLLRAIITAKGIKKTDFTVVVRMGKSREADRFYVVPTEVVWKEIGKRQTEQKPRGRKEIGMYRLSFFPVQSRKFDGHPKKAHTHCSPQRMHSDG
jgi:hypothetical protein